MCRNAITCSTMVILFGLAGCCWEGTPALRERDVTLNEVPARVRDAFERGYDLDEVTRVEQTSFKSICAGDSFWYRFHLADGQTVTLDKGGQLARWQDGIRDEEPRQGGT